MLAGISHLEGNLYIGMKTAAPLRPKISSRFKAQPKSSRLRRFPRWQQTFHPPVSIRHAAPNFPPNPALFALQSYMHAHRWPTQRQIQNVRRNPAHRASHFRSRSCVICRCCSAASRNSVSASFPRRR